MYYTNIKHVHHYREIKELESKLELEREKRELLEREADMLRLELHQANNTLLHYKALLAAETANTSVLVREQAVSIAKVISNIFKGTK